MSFPITVKMDPRTFLPCMFSVTLHIFTNPMISVLDILINGFARMKKANQVVSEIFGYFIIKPTRLVHYP